MGQNLETLIMRNRFVTIIPHSEFYSTNFVIRMELLIKMANSIKRVKSTIPADRLCLIQLEDGIDWDTICPFLEVPVPKSAPPWTSRSSSAP